MKLLKEFKEFINRGNVMDMAIGIIIGGAFKTIVDSLVGDIINPFLGIVGGLDFSQWCWDVFGDGKVQVMYGNFITSIISFLLMAVVVFALMKIVNTITGVFKKKKEEPAAAPTTKVCPFCKSEINIEAKKCPHCTSDLED